MDLSGITANIRPARLTNVYNADSSLTIHNAYAW